MSNPSTEIVIADETTSADVERTIASFSNPASSVFSSISGQDRQSRLDILDAMTNAVPLFEHLGDDIPLVHFVLQAITVNDPQRGPQNAIRTLLIDANGKAYHAVSDGVVKALQNITGVMGEPDKWVEPTVIRAKAERGSSGRTYHTLLVVNTGKPRAPKA